MSNNSNDQVIKSSLKLKKGTLFKKKKKVDLREIDLTIKKPEEQSKKTAAELAFEKRQRDTAFERLSKKAATSHREKVGSYFIELNYTLLFKVEQFNKQMDSLTEFNGNFFVFTLFNGAF
jgi:LPS O-antigen subunit length determinant protein (WzzB/FepE family)